MVKESLIEYTSRLLKEGYGVGAIRSSLINAGYSPYEVNQAIAYAQATAPERRAIHITGRTAVIILSLLIILIIIVIGAIILLSPEEKTISISAIPAKTAFNPGEKLTFICEIMSSAERTADVALNYDLIDKKKGIIIATKQERKTVGLKESASAELSIPETASPGDYQLAVTASYEGKTVQAFSSITIAARPAAAAPLPATEELSAECPATCDDYNRCTNDFCEKGICRHTPIIPCCGNGLCEAGENLLNCVDDCRERENTPEELTAQARTVAMTDSESAAIICSSIARSALADECFSQIAASSGKSLLCENAQDSENKDRCYVSFALEGDFSVCTRIKDSYLSKACYSLQKTEQIKASVQARANQTA